MEKKNNANKLPPIYIVSGGKGLAGDAVVQSVLIQFPNNKVPVMIVPDVLTAERIDEVTSMVLSAGGVIVHTMVDPEARMMLTESCDRKEVKHIDLVGDLSGWLSALLHREPISKPGLYRLRNIDYFKRIEAIDFTLKVDDGQNPEKIKQADIVLTGVSRTGKTPLSVYLAMFGWKVANVPIVPGIDLPEELFLTDPGRVFGLNISSVYLIAQRANRIQHLGMDEGADYVDRRKVNDELEYARRIFARGGFTEIQVTNKPIESSANEILTILTARYNMEEWKREAL